MSQPDLPSPPTDPLRATTRRSTFPLDSVVKPVFRGHILSTSQEARNLLQSRLIVLGLLSLVVYGFCIAEGILIVPGADVAPTFGRVGLSLAFVNIVSGIVLLAILVRHRALSLSRLRAGELMFAVQATLFFAWWRWTDLSTIAQRTFEGAGHQRMTLLFDIIRNNLAWFGLIVGYGLLIPNTWRRCAMVVAGLALAPLIITLMGGLTNEIVHANFRLVMAATTTLLGTGCALAVFGSFKLSALEEEARAARREATELGQYHLKARLGSGAMGEV
ncbi:MAG TPA: hypothetical protein VJY33_08570, partial [Isosphaeraceae bacterium]|nr:hypothetical protein [Isosphaeraceae bacterium]